MYKTVRSACIRSRRQQLKTGKVQDDHVLHDLNTRDPSAYDNLVQAETARLLRAALQQLPAGCRQVMELHFLEGRSLVEIASILKKDSSTVRHQKKAGLQALKKTFLRLAHFFL